MNPVDVLTAARAQAAILPHRKPQPEAFQAQENELRSAVQSSDLSRVSELLSELKSLDAFSVILQRNFLWACNYGDPAMVSLFLREGADLATRSHANLSPLHKAVMSGSLETVKVLINAGADSSASSHEGLSATETAKALWLKDILSFLESRCIM